MIIVVSDGDDRVFIIGVICLVFIVLIDENWGVCLFECWDYVFILINCLMLFVCVI